MDFPCPTVRDPLAVDNVVFMLAHWLAREYRTMLVFLCLWTCYTSAFTHPVAAFKMASGHTVQ